jgi:ubiquinone/menaquinone biosynthesis C-methylase UbiE
MTMAQCGVARCLMPERRSHPVFARVYAKFAEISDRRGGGEHRQRLLEGLNGRVIEIGAGSGANFCHYPTTVDEVVAVEPERYLREHAQRAAAQAIVPISLVDGSADQLPSDAESFDAGVVALGLTIERVRESRCSSSRRGMCCG